MEDHRWQRVSIAVHEELGEIIGFEMEDPRLSTVNVTSTEVSPDGRHAHVKVSIGSGDERKVLAALEHAKNFLRQELASRLNLRRVPDLNFSADSHPEAESRIDFLLRRARRTRARDQGNGT